MKYNLSLTVTAIIISSLFLVMWVSACKDDDTGIPYFDFVIHSPGPQDSGFASAKVFDKTWEATAYIFPYYLEPQYVSVIFNTFTPEGYIRDEVLLAILLYKKDRIRSLNIQPQARSRMIISFGEVMRNSRMMAMSSMEDMNWTPHIIISFISIGSIP